MIGEESFYSDYSSIEATGSLHYQDFEKGVVFILHFIQALLISEVPNRVNKKNVMLYICIG